MTKFKLTQNNVELKKGNWQECLRHLFDIYGTSITIKALLNRSVKITPILRTVR